MKFFIFFLLISTSVFAKNGILFKTSTGDLLFELDYEKAPKTSRYFANLASTSLFEGIKFNFINKNVGARTEFIEDTAKASTTNLDDFIAPQEYEESGLKHVRGALSLTTDEKRPKGTSSFGLIFTDQPALDGKRTVFGRLIRGEKILERLEYYENDAYSKPFPELTILSSKVVKASEFSEIELEVFEDRRFVGLTEKMSEKKKNFFYGLSIVWVILVGFFFAPVSKRAKTVALTFLLVTSFSLLHILGSSIQDSQMAGIMIVFLGLATFRLMGNYE